MERAGVQVIFAIAEKVLEVACEGDGKAEFKICSLYIVDCGQARTERREVKVKVNAI